MVPPLLQDHLLSSTDNTTLSTPTRLKWSHSQIEHQKLNDDVDITQPAAPQMQENVKFSIEKSDMSSYPLKFNGSQISSQYDELHEVKAFLADINSHKKGYESQLQVKYSIYSGLV